MITTWTTIASTIRMEYQSIASRQQLLSHRIKHLAPRSLTYQFHKTTLGSPLWSQIDRLFSNTLHQRHLRPSIVASKSSMKAAIRKKHLACFCKVPSIPMESQALFCPLTMTRTSYQAPPQSSIWQTIRPLTTSANINLARTKSSHIKFKINRYSQVPRTTYLF